MMSAQRWFQRRRTGLGWQPASWQGWTITLVVVGALVTAVALLRGSSVRLPVVIAILAAYIVIALATGGARPRELPSPRERGEGESDPGVGGDAQREALGTLTAGRSTTGSSAEPALVVEHLTKRFGGRLAVDDISFSVGVGEVFGFLGPNGAGKTTTVRMLATVISPTSGRARVAGMPLEQQTGSKCASGSR